MRVRHGFTWAIGLSAIWDNHRRNLFVTLPFYTAEFRGRPRLPPGVDEAKLVELNMTPEHAEFVFEDGNPMRAFADAFAEHFTRIGAKNYITMNTFSPKLGAFTVTMQRQGGITPSQDLDQWKAKATAFGPKSLEEEKAKFEADMRERMWLIDEDFEWNAASNCYARIAVHLAWVAWRSRAGLYADKPTQPAEQG